MAKMFYTMQETMAALGRNEEGIKQLAREGRLREFRDGPRLMFKADQVEQVKAELGGGGGEIPLAHESGAPLSLAGDTRGGSAAGGLSLADTGGGTRTGSGHGSAGGTDVPAKEDTQFADIGLSGSLGGSLGGSVGGIPSPAGTRAGTRSGTGAPLGGGSGILNLGGSGSGSGLSNASGSRGGITVFDVDESQRVDPMAQTAINAGIQDQINLEGVGSGSGLLDLTRESDDTSLGAVFDELQPGQGRRSPSASAAGSVAAYQAPAMATDEDFTSVPPPSPSRTGAGGRAALAAPIYVEAADPVGEALGWAGLGASLIVLFGAFVLTAVLLGYRPEILDSLRLNHTDSQFVMYALLAVGVVVILSIIGYVVGKATSK